MLIKKTFQSLPVIRISNENKLFWCITQNYKNKFWCNKYLIKTPFPLQYFVASLHENHEDFIECLHYDDVFCHIYDTEIMTRLLFFVSDKWRYVAFTFYSGNTFGHDICDDVSFLNKNNFLKRRKKNKKTFLMSKEK